MTTDIILEAKVKTEIKEPTKFNVILVNDDFTPMEFVTSLLMEVFDKDPQEALDVMMEVHKNGRGIAGVYNEEVAKEKQHESMTAARYYGHPLQVLVEEI